jgi:hypothetical protein
MKSPPLKRRDLGDACYLHYDESQKADAAARATAMSCSTLPPLAPTAPITALSTLIGVPPPKMTTLDPFVVLSPKPGWPLCVRRARSSVDASKARAVQALLIAMSTLPIHAR